MTNDNILNLPTDKRPQKPLARTGRLFFFEPTKVADYKKEMDWRNQTPKPMTYSLKLASHLLNQKSLNEKDQFYLKSIIEDYPELEEEINEILLERFSISLS